MFRRLILTLVVLTSVLGTAGARAAQVDATSPIRHVIVMYQENHSFDNVLGYWCAQTNHCVGLPATVTLKGHTVVTPKQAPDIVPQVDHSVASQLAALDAGAMDGWERSTAALARPTRVSVTTRRTSFPMSRSRASSRSVMQPSVRPTVHRGAGISMQWRRRRMASSATTLHPRTQVRDGDATSTRQARGSVPLARWSRSHRAFRTLRWDRKRGCVQSHSRRTCRRSWIASMRPPCRKIYATTTGPKTGGGSYNWATCPSFAECLDTSQRANLVSTDKILTDAAAGTSPAFGLLLPGDDKVDANASQHNGTSMTVGDNWIGKVVTALEASPDWSSTVLFITYDDCGCFYDQVVPGTNPDGSQEGTRVPLMIVSPYAVSGYVDKTPTTFGILAYVEETFGLAPLGVNDAGAYPFTNAFNYSQTPLSNVRMVQRPVTAVSTQCRRWRRRPDLKLGVLRAPRQGEGTHVRGPLGGLNLRVVPVKMTPNLTPSLLHDGKPRDVGPLFRCDLNMIMDLEDLSERRFVRRKNLVSTVRSCPSAPSF